MIATLVTTFDRPEALARSLPQIAALERPLLVVDDGTPDWEKNARICEKHNAHYLLIPSNRGLAVALNMGLTYWLADKNIRYISYFQDDVDVHPKVLDRLLDVCGQGPLLTGHDAGEHPAFAASGPLRYKKSCRATHMMADREFWREIMPIPTFILGAPCRNGDGRGYGSNVDWWIVRDAPKSVQKTGRQVVCFPGLVRTFAWKATDSCWNNEQRTGEDPPLSK